jgi:hypothetical protein
MSVPSCGHGVDREIEPYRGVRVWRMKCGEVACELSMRDFFQPAYIAEWIDGALDGKTDGWHSLDLKRLAELKAAGV